MNCDDDDELELEPLDRHAIPRIEGRSQSIAGATTNATTILEVRTDELVDVPGGYVVRVQTPKDAPAYTLVVTEGRGNAAIARTYSVPAGDATNPTDVFVPVSSALERLLVTAQKVNTGDSDFTATAVLEARGASLNVAMPLGDTGANDSVPSVGARLQAFSGAVWSSVRAGLTAVTGTLTGWLNTLPFALYHETPTSRTNNQGGPLEGDEKGSLKVVALAPAIDSSDPGTTVTLNDLLVHQFTAGTCKQGVIVCAPIANTAPVYVAYSGSVTTATGIELNPGDREFFACVDSSSVYSITGTATQHLQFVRV